MLEEIKDLKSFKEWLNAVNCPEIEDYYQNELDNYGRDLYDYFDSLGIYGSVYGSNEDWSFDICIGDICEMQRFDFNTRKEAEEALFTEMFKIRDKQL